MPDSTSEFRREFPALADALAGQFAVERELGRGGMGVVFLAREVTLDRLVALKVLPEPLAADPDTRERFLREARTAARLAHPNVVPVHRADEAGGTAFFAMAFVDGESLGDRIRDRGPLPAADAVPILRAAAWALAYAHARGVVHRDVKPENILLERATGHTLVTDFGIAGQLAPDDAARLTRDGLVLGTLQYMSPEQAGGEPLDGRSDVYSLGVVAYEALSGRPPFADLAGPAVLVAHVTREAPPLRTAAPAVPSELARVVDRCLAKRPADRYATAEALADALTDALERSTAAAPPAGADLPPGLPERLDDAQAAAIWRRAARLQADAMRRMESRPAPLRAAATPAADADGGYRGEDVVDAADEAGISRQYVALALAELPRGGLPAAAATEIDERQATRFLGTDVRSVGVSLVVAAPPARTLRLLGAALQQLPYALRLRETIGPHPLDGGVIVFELPGPIVGAGGAPAGMVNFYWLGTHQQLEARQLQVTLRAVAGDAAGRAGGPPRTEVAMTADLRPGVRRNVRAAQWISAVAGGGSGLGTAAVLAKGAAVAASAAVLGPALGVGAIVAGAGLLWYRRLYPATLRRAEAEMRGALEAVASAVESDAVFGPAPARLGEGA